MREEKNYHITKSRRTLTSRNTIFMATKMSTSSNWEIAKKIVQSSKRIDFIVVVVALVM